MQLNVKQPMEEEGSAAYTPTPAAVHSALPHLVYQNEAAQFGEAETSVVFHVAPTSEMTTSMRTACTVVPPALASVQQAPALAQEVVAPVQPVKANDSTSDVIDSMYERLGSKFNQVATLASHQQEAQTLLHNLICGEGFVHQAIIHNVSVRKGYLHGSLR